MEGLRIAVARGTYDLERSLVPRLGPPILVVGLAQHPKLRCWCTSVRWWGSATPARHVLSKPVATEIHIPAALYRAVLDAFGAKVRM